jgi:hypothetical protein
LTEDVLHRLAEAEVDPQRKRPDQLRQSHVCAIRTAAHAFTLPLARASSRLHGVRLRDRDRFGGVSCAFGRRLQPPPVARAFLAQSD